MIPSKKVPYDIESPLYWINTCGESWEDINIVTTVNEVKYSHRAVTINYLKVKIRTRTS